MNGYHMERRVERLEKMLAATSELTVRIHADKCCLLEACQYVVNWHRKNDSGEGELFGLDFVTTCISAIHKATE